MDYKTISCYDFYLNSEPFEVATANKIIDNTIGMHPCYYALKGGKLRISGSAYALIKDLGGFEQNNNISIGRYATSYETHDKRVMRLKAFHAIECIDGKLVDADIFTTTDNLDLNSFIEKEAELLTRHINTIETKYPDAIHIAEVGGKDSQLILLAPKLSKNWHVFSAQPNYPIVKKFIEINNIAIDKTFTSTGDNEYGDTKFIEEKIIVLDGLQFLADYRWGKNHREIIRDNFNGKKVIFWDGDSGNRTNTRLNIIKSGSKTTKEFFDFWRLKAPISQGITAQYYKNLGFIRLDVYSFPQLWKDVLMQCDPIKLMAKDNRKELGDRIFGKTVKWIEENPGPPAWQKQLEYDVKKIYYEHVKRNSDEN